MAMHQLRSLIALQAHASRGTHLARGYFGRYTCVSFRWKSPEGLCVVMSCYIVPSVPTRREQTRLQFLWLVKLSSSLLALPTYAFSKQCAQWDTGTALASGTGSAIQLAESSVSPAGRDAWGSAEGQEGYPAARGAFSSAGWREPVATTQRVASCGRDPRGVGSRGRLGGGGHLTG